MCDMILTDTGIVLQKLIAKKYIGLHGGISKEESVTIDRRNDDKILSKNLQLTQQHQTSPSSFDSDEMLKTAIELDRSDLDKKLMTARRASKSTPTTSSINSYKRSVSPDTMLQGATSCATSISVNFFHLFFFV